MRLELTPRQGLEAAAGSDSFVTRDRPEMTWTPSAAERRILAGRGGVRIEARLRLVAGELREPRVSLDWGDGFSSDTRSLLSLGEDGVYTAVAYTNAGALQGLLLEPSARPCEFRIEAFTVEPVGEVSPAIVHLSPLRRWVRRGLRLLPARLQNAIRTGRRFMTASTPVRARMASRMMGAFSSRRWRRAYGRDFDIARNLRSPFYAAKPLAPPRRDPEGALTVAFYLPQFYPFPQNDAWWGTGFTEWTNVTKARPQFVGHHQPRMPQDLGYYDLRVAETRHAQVDLAGRIGVDAFCFHYYWFGGQRLLERPLDAFVEDPDLDFPFALCWANENWTRRWDGQEADILIGQRHSAADDLAVLEDLARYMRSPRYLRIGGKPVLLVYRPESLPDAAATLTRWRDHARKLGLGELFLLCTDAFGFADYRDHGFDGIVEFPPHALKRGEITDEVDRLNLAFAGRVYDYPTVVEDRVADLDGRRDGRRYPGVMPSWDNEARKPGAGHVFHNASPDAFHRWLLAARAFTRRAAPPGERLVFVNAWNEWAEGAYLEPDRWFGHGFGQAVRAAAEAEAPRLPSDHAALRAPERGAKTSSAVVLLHLYYPELIDEFAQRLSTVTGAADLSITFPDIWSKAELERLAKAFPNARLSPTPNLGRDIAPFLGELRWAREQGYEVFCKLHSKRSPHMAGGEAWRSRLLDGLIGGDRPQAALGRFAAEPDLGLLSNAVDRVVLGQPGIMHNNRENVTRLAKALRLQISDDTPFVAGSMFWGRVSAFQPLLALTPEDLRFEVELGRIDGTLAHAIERLTGAVVASSGRRIAWDL